jgi:hypothetical protein
MSEIRASESTHWYDVQGNPVYTVKAKNGNDRNTTLADAKKLGLKPGVTTIIGLAASPSLEIWKQEQLLHSALTATRLPDETEQDFISRIKQDAQEQSKKSRERGTQIHAWLQDGFSQGTSNPEALDFFFSAQDELNEKLGELKWDCELSFATERYGGKIDLQNDEYILDIKTTEKDLTDIKLWENHYMQLAAYDHKHTHKCGILFINTLTAESKLVMVEEDKLDKGYKMFNALVDYYFAKSGL